MTYSRLINGLAKAGIEVDRKVLADLAVHEPEAFNAIAERPCAGRAWPCSAAAGFHRGQCPPGFDEPPPAPLRCG
jgi:hypothetical protein